MLDDPKTMREVLSTLDVNSLEKLRIAFDKWFERIETFIEKLMSGFESPNETIKYLRDEYNTFRKLWVEGIQDAIKNAQNTEVASKEALTLQDYLRSSKGNVKAPKEMVADDGYAVKEPVKRYSLKEVAPIRPSSESWQRSYTTEEARKVFANLWNVDADEAEMNL